MAHTLPFSVSGAKIIPIGSDNAAIVPVPPCVSWFRFGNPPPILPPRPGDMLQVDTLIGRLGSPDKLTENATIDRSSFDPSGNLLYGKDLSTQSLVPWLLPAGSKGD